jgi:hypothetical protein
MLIPERVVSNVIYVAYRAPIKYGAYGASVSRLVTNRTMIVKIKEITSSAANATALPYTPGTVMANRIASFSGALAAHT